MGEISDFIDQEFTTRGQIQGEKEIVDAIDDTGVIDESDFFDEGE